MSEENNKTTTPETKKEGEEEKKELTIPKSRFDEVNSKFKESQKELEAFREKEKKESEAKLLEEKKYDELLKAKELEIETHKKDKESLRKNMLLEKVNNKIINIANKEGAIDSEDILRFIDTQDLLELESNKLEETIKERVSKIKNNKAHLFTTLQRDNKENGVPYSVNTNNTKSSKPKTKEDAILEALTLSRK